MRKPTWLFLVCVGLPSASVAHAAASDVVLRCDNQRAISQTVPPTGHFLSVRLEVASGADVLVEIEEHGQDLQLRTDERFETRSIPIPPRFGVSFFKANSDTQLRSERLRAGTGHGQVLVRLHCDASIWAPLWHWLERGNRVGTALSGGVGSLHDTDLDSELAALADTAFDRRSGAWAEHLRAQYLLLAGRAADAGDAFQSVARMWESSGDLARAAAARVGAAEDFVRSGRYREALDLTRSSAASPDPSNYFGVRLENSRCLALHYLEAMQDSADCYAWTTRHLDVLGEFLELAATGLDYAAVESTLGNLEQARAIAQRSLSIAQGPQSLVVQGRAHYTLANIAFRDGRPSDALHHLHQAQGRFSEGRNLRWEAAMLIRLATVFTDLNAYGDARLAARRASSLLDPVHAAAPHANALVALARADSAEGRFESSIDALESAAATLERLEMPQETTIAKIELARQLILAERIDDAERVLATVKTNTPQGRTLAGLTEAEIELAHGRIDDARGILQRIDPGLQSLSDRLRHQRLSAWVTWYSGHKSEAMIALRTEAKLLSRLADEAGSALLSHMLVQSIRQLRTTAVEMIARDVDASAGTEDAVSTISSWQGLLLPQPSRTTIDSPEIDHASRIDRAMGYALLASQSASSTRNDAWRHLLAMMAERRPVPASTIPRGPSLDLERLAQLDKPVVLLVEGEHRALLIWLTVDQSLVHSIDDLATVKRLIDNLDRETRSASGSTRLIHQLSAELSGRLLGPFQGIARPARLRIFNEGLASRVPWPQLYWPDDDRLLADHPISLVEITADGGETRPRAAEAIDVLEATQGANNSALNELRAAAVESRLIDAHVTDRQVRAHPGASRELLLDIMGTPGAWVHISAHGTLEPSLLAGSGLWLDPQTGGGTPEYVSWVDFLSGGAKADLAVLNACQLAAADPAAASSTMSFATALSRAGVQHVVAARWPVSDTASNLWVPAFYKALAATDPPDPALALAEARRALRASRAFRHPFHWAGWVHIERVHVVD